MERLTKFLNSINEAIEQQQAQQMGRPTSLREAGRVGETAEGRSRRPVRPEEAIETGAEQTAEERTERRRRPMTNAPLPRRTATSATQIRTVLRNPASFRTAVLIREVLDVPVSRRPRRR